MAGTKNNGRRTTGGGKKTSGAKTKKASQSKSPQQDNEFLRSEVLVIGSFALALLLFLSNFHLCGMVGDYLRMVQLGIFGIIGFVAPILLFVGTCFALSNQGNPIAALKLGAVIVGVWVLCALAEMFLGEGFKEGTKAAEAFFRSSASGTGGGFLGGLLVILLGSTIGVIGTYVVLFVLLAICMVLITEKSLVAFVKKGGNKAYQYAKEDVNRRRVIHEERKEEKRRLREEQKVRGVNLGSTTLQETFEEEAVQEEAIFQEQADIFTGSIQMPQSPRPDPEPPEPENEALYVRKDTRTLKEMNMMEEKEAFWEEEQPDMFHILEKKEKPYKQEDSWEEGIPSQAEPWFEEDTFGQASQKNQELNEAEDWKELSESDSKEVWQDIPDSPKDSVELWQGSKEEDRTAFSIPEESKRVVTASGKIIESDTEALKKKVELRREEAVEDGDLVIPYKAPEPVMKQEYQFPPLNLLKWGAQTSGSSSDKEYRETAIKLQQTLRNFGVGVTVTNISCGPSVTRYELHPEQGVKVSKIVGLADDIKLNLAAADIRIEAPIPGKSAVGIEVPNKENNVVYLRELLESDDFKKNSSKLSFAVGKDIGGQVVVTDVAKMPHLLIAGATGSGKSVCINTLIMSLLYKAHPDDVKMIMIDPKVVELSAYNGIPHLMIPVVTDPKKASGALNWAVAEMMDRYKKFAKYNVRNLQGYNAKVESIEDLQVENKPEKMPQIVIIVDELADLMMVSPGEVEDAICRLAQLARAAGIHLVIATQRPSVNVITGLIKANVPSRIAFSVSSGVDSRTIIDMYGAEKLLGKGDMLFYPAGYQKPQRVQGAFVSDSEVSKVVEFLTEQNLPPSYNPEIEDHIVMPVQEEQSEAKNNGRDEYFATAGRFIIEKEKGSIGMLQRMFKIGFNRAARIMDQLAEAGVVGEEEGTKPRRILMTLEEFENLLEQEGSHC